MIFVTVGTQLPFERLLESVDVWAAKKTDQTVFAQVGQTQYQPKNFQTVVSMTPNEYDRHLSSADVIIGHVGMGTIISGIQYNKPLILMPRHAHKGEHRNDHQLSTARQFGKLSLVTIVDSQEEMESALKVVLHKKNAGTDAGSMMVSPSLVKKISDFITKDYDGQSS